jgi:hypothetical protein
MFFCLTFFIVSSTYGDSSTEGSEPFESPLRAADERTVVVTPKGKYNCRLCNIDKRIHGRKEDHDKKICPVKLGERQPRPPSKRFVTITMNSS